MSSVHHLREFISGRLTAAATEIFSEFEKTILRYEEEMERQRRLLDLCWKPELKLRRVDLQQEPVHKKICKQERNSSLDQEEPEPPQFEEPEPPQMKVEDEELCTNQEEDQLHLKQETDPVLVTVLYKESEPEPDKEQLISQSSAGPEGHHGDQAGQSATSETTFSCQICGETFSDTYLLSSHVKVHRVWNQNSDKLMYCCPTCGKTISGYSHLLRHMRFHTGLKPFSCKTCGKGFSQNYYLNWHMRVHTGEKPFICKMCGKSFNQFYHLNRHMKVHTGEKPFVCKTCGKRFNRKAHLTCHMISHTGEKPFVCKTCEYSFKHRSDLTRHMKIHTGLRPFVCKTCGKRFSRNTHLTRHMNVHTGSADALQSQEEKSFTK